MGLRQEGLTPEVIQESGIRRGPVIDALGMVLKILRRKKGPGLDAVFPAHLDILVEGPQIRVAVHPALLNVFPDMDAAAPGDGSKQGGLPRSVFPGEEGNIGGELNQRCLLEGGQVKRVPVLNRLAFRVQDHLFNMHALFAP